MLPPRSTRSAQRALMCLCDPTRFRIVRALEATELAAGDIAIVIARSRSATSHHLRILSDASAVRGRRDGNVIRYSLADDLTTQVLRDLGAAFDRFAPKFNGGSHAPSR